MGIRDILHLASCILHPSSCIPHPASRIPHPASFLIVIKILRLAGVDRYEPAHLEAIELAGITGVVVGHEVKSVLPAAFSPGLYHFEPQIKIKQSGIAHKKVAKRSIYGDTGIQTVIPLAIIAVDLGCNSIGL